MTNWEEEFDKQFPNGLDSFHKAYWKELSNGERLGIQSQIINEVDNVKQFIKNLLK